MNIIAVDDERIALEGLVHAVREASPDSLVMGFRYAEDALTYAKENICDVAFLDIEMTGTKGTELALMLKEINPSVNIIFATGFDSYFKDAFDMHASGYLKKPITPEKVRAELENLRNPISSAKRLTVQAFGNFEVYFAGKPLSFQYSRSKELFAYLIDRGGAMCSTGELMEILFEEESGHDAYFKRIRRDLLDTIASVGCESALVCQRGMMGVVTSQIECDYYNYLSGREPLSKRYRGEYMNQYTFGEYTNGYLQRILNK